MKSRSSPCFAPKPRRVGKTWFFLTPSSPQQAEDATSCAVFWLFPHKGHGRIEIRTITTSEMMNSHSSWPGLAQVYHLEREFQWWCKGRKIRTSVEVEFGITSLKRKEVSASELLSFRRNHWGIETGLHYRRDVTFKEDALRMTVGNTGKIVACIHNLVISLIKQAGYDNVAKARRYYAGHLSEAFDLLLSAPARL